MRRRVSPVSALLALCGALPWTGVQFGARFAKAPIGDGGEGGAGGDGGGGTEDKGGAGGEGGAGGGGAGGEDEPKIPKRQYDALMKESQQRKRELADLNAKIADIQKNAPSQEEIEELRELRVQKAKMEEEQAKKAGRHDELVAKIKADAQKAQDELTAKAAKLTAELHQTRITNALSLLIPRYTTAPVQDVLDLIQKYVSWDDETSDFIVKVRGETPENAEGKEMTLEEWVESEINKRTYLAAHKPAGGSGSGGGSGKGKGGKGKAGEYDEEDLENMSQEDFRKNRQAILAQTNSGR